ncbi:MAG: methyltransferase domain-containing protein [Verrucomicrobia bacterium]|nr:methyltransferase domain-containing protein [Verrucomicrobiota bacterium]
MGSRPAAGFRHRGGRPEAGRTLSHHGFGVRQFAGRFPSLQERWYVMGKLATDPLYPAVHDVLQGTTAPLLDVGCGMGVLAFYLRQRGWQPAIIGLDCDPRKIATARRVAADFAGTQEFFLGDAGLALPAHCGSVTLLDILQYFPPDTREVLLREGAARIADDGVLVIRTGLMDDTRRFRVTRLVDRMAALVKWIEPPPVHYPGRAELCRVLHGAGLIGDFEPQWGRTPFNNWLGVFRRTAPH